MPNFSVEVTRTAVHTTSISVNAADQEAAESKAEALCEEAAGGTGKLMGPKVEWDEDSIQFEVGSVDED